MFPIPSEVQTLLKSKCMIGEHIPTGTFSVLGSPIGGLIDSTVWSNFITVAGPTPNRSYGNVAETVDGRAIVAFIEGTTDGEQTLRIAYAPSIAGLLNQTEVFDFANSVILKSNLTGAQCSLNLVDDKLRLCFISMTGRTVSDTMNAEYWEDTDGNGTDLAYKSSMATDMTESFAPSFCAQTTLIERMGNGTLLCILPWMYSASGIGCSVYRMCVSDDDGVTWSMPHSAFHSGWIDNSNFCSSGSMLHFNDQYAITKATRNAGGHYSLGWNSLDGTYSDLAWPLVAGTLPYFATFATFNGKHYMMAKHNNNYAAIYDWPHDTITFNDGSSTDLNLVANWRLLKDFTQNCSKDKIIVTSSAIVLNIFDGSKIMVAGSLIEKTQLPIKSLTVDKSKGGASQGTAVLDNKDGMYAPDNINSPWFQKLWLNKEVTITMGYGLAQQAVFKGLIDTIEMDNYAEEGPTLEVVSRDYSKRALDQMAQMYVTEPYPHVAYVLLYLWQTPEYIFRDLALKAGWVDAKIHTEVTGIVIPKFETPHEQYGDSFQRLAELSGFEWTSDELGEIYFRVAVDPAPVAKFVYREGEDIFKIGYKFTDGELYRDVVVWSMTSTDPDDKPVAVRATATWSAADYNNVLPHKTMIVQAADIVTTQEGCQEIANRIANSITPKPRLVNFVMVGNPYLQIGDCIQVIESSTTISELYRIQEMTHQVSAEGDGIVFSTSVKAYHYAYVPG